MGPTERVKPRRLKGFQDYGPELMRARYQVMDAVRQVALRAGFQPMATPALEYAEVLLGVGGETDKQVYRFLDNGEREVGLRFDLTVPFARYVAEHFGELVFPLKRLQMGEVWRAEKPQKGRYREFMQCDLDIIGVDTLAADVEILSSLFEILASLNVGPFTMVVGHRVLLTHFINGLLGVGPEAHGPILIAIDKLAKIGADGVIGLIVEATGLPVATVQNFVQILATKDDHGETPLALIEPHVADPELVLRFRHTLTALRAIAPEGCAGRYRVDLSVARGLGYYTGIVFESTLDDAPGFGSVCSGGRYDRLVERFTNQPLAGVGGSVGLDRLVAALQEAGSQTGVKDKTVYVAIAGDAAYPYGLSICHELRRAGIACDMALKLGKLAPQFKYADRRGLALVLTVGTDEEARETFALKDMATGTEEKDLPRHDVVNILRSKIN